MCECNTVGGPWVTVDPECPIHGYEAQRLEREREKERMSTDERIAELERQVEALVVIARDSGYAI